MPATMEMIPRIDLDIFLTGSHDSESVIQESRKVVEALRCYGAFLLHDSRVEEKHNEAFLDLMEDYFNQPLDDLRKHSRIEPLDRDNLRSFPSTISEPLDRDNLRKIQFFNSGSGSSLSQVLLAGFMHGASSSQGLLAGFRDMVVPWSPNMSCPTVTGSSFSMSKESRETSLARFTNAEVFDQPDPAVSPTHPSCRFFFYMKKIENVPSPDFLSERWDRIMDQWGQSMKNAIEDLLDMISIGLDLPAGTIREGLGPHGIHVLGPTAVDLVKYGQKGAILSESHSDLSFLSIHGRSRYPSLYIWTTNTNERIRVEIPPGSNFLVQAGRQLEHITTYGHSDNELPLIVKGGPIRAGRHEVVVNDQTLAAIKRQKENFPNRPQALIRVSSTFFWHFQSEPGHLVLIPKRRATSDNPEAGLNEGDEVV